MSDLETQLSPRAGEQITMRCAHLAPGIARDAVRLLDGLADGGQTAAN